MWAIINVIFSYFPAIFVLVICFYLTKFILWYWKIRAATERLRLVPGDDGHWFYGNLKEFPGPNEDGLKYLVNRAEKFENRFFKFVVQPFLPNVMLCHPDTIKHLLKYDESKALTRHIPWLGYGLLLSHGEKWHRNRKLLTPAFHFDILKSYMTINNDAVSILMKKWSAELKKDPKNSSIEIFSSISLCTLDVILRCAFSYTENVQLAQGNNEYLNAVASLAEHVNQRKYVPLWYFDFVYNRTAHARAFYAKCNIVHKVAEDVIARRRRILQEEEENDFSTSKRHRDFLDIVLKARDEDGKGLTDLEIRNEVDTFLFAGHDTTASAISWCLYNFAKHEQHQTIVRQEIDRILTGRPIKDITWDDLNEMPYLTMCIRESMRLIPPVPLINRCLTRELKIDGVTLLPKTVVEIPIYVLNHNRDIWGDDHMEFKPQRFDLENMKSMDPFAYIPFSAGPRNCIGQVFAMHEIKVLVSRILHRFRLELDTDNPPAMIPRIVMLSKNGIRLRLFERVN